MDLTQLIPQFGGLAWTALAFVVALSVIVTVHELGHYLVGRWCGIGAEVFSLGLGPVLFSRIDRRGTRWQVAAVPFGGYVKFVGDSGAASGRDETALATMNDIELRRTVHGAPLWARAATVAAGPVFNFILSVFVFAGVMFVDGVARVPVTVASVAALPAGSGDLRPGDEILAIDGRDLSDKGQVPDSVLSDAAEQTYRIRRDGREMTVTAPNMFPALVGSVVPSSAGADIGLLAGDVILSIDGAPISSFAELRDRTGASQGRPVLLKVWRDGTTLEFTLVPRQTDLPTGGGGFETRWLIGLTGDMLISPQTVRPGPVQALSYGGRQTWDIVETSLSGLWHMVRGRISSCNLRGPLGIAETSGDAASQGPLAFIWFIAVLSTAVGLMNLFPVPILDGGHLVFHAWEAVTGRAPGDRALRGLMSMGLVLLVALMLFALTNDVRC